MTDRELFLTQHILMAMERMQAEISDHNRRLMALEATRTVKRTGPGLTKALMAYASLTATLIKIAPQIWSSMGFLGSVIGRTLRWLLGLW